MSSYFSHKGRSQVRHLLLELQTVIHKSGRGHEQDIDGIESTCPWRIQNVLDGFQLKTL
jgi:hypothetical protein